MKKVFTILTLVTLFCVAGIHEAEAARIRIPVGSYQKMSKVRDLPQEEYYQTTDDEHFDLGVKYTVYQICWIPVWTESAPELVGYINNDYYVSFDEEDIELLAEMNEIPNIQKLAKMPFWDAWGGKLIFIVIIGIILYGSFSKSGDDDDEVTEKAA
ncbi:MAG: hypothetical protein LIP01_08900 [Tannerellaceae bacterium]|nr:hypothetical protein [Tannerellaceae bacterium]